MGRVPERWFRHRPHLFARPPTPPTPPRRPLRPRDRSARAPRGHRAGCEGTLTLPWQGEGAPHILSWQGEGAPDTRIGRVELVLGWLGGQRAEVSSSPSVVFDFSSRSKILSLASATMTGMSQMADEPGRQWVSVGNGYELSLEGTTLVCRDDQGRICEPIPQRVLESRTYPAWALIHDPGDAEAALGSVAGLERASREKSREAAAIHESLALGLPVAHLPVFWEHIARTVLATGDVKRAAVAFSRAREVERAHALPVDGTVWLRSHLEFAAAGALGGRTASAFGTELGDRFEPEQALDALTNVAVLRTQNESPPWPELARQLTVLARAAGRDATTEQQRLIERLLPLPAIRQTPFALWKAWRPALVPLATSSPQVRGLLLDLFPVADDIDGWWLELLGECTALGALTGDDPSGPEPLDGAAGWLSRTVVHGLRPRRDRRPKPLPPQFPTLIARMSARLATDGIPVRVVRENWIDVRALEACLAHGVPVAAPGKGAALDIIMWIFNREPGEDIPALAADPDFAALLHTTLDQRDQRTFARVPALRPLLRPASDGRPTGLETIPEHPLDDADVATALYGLADSAFEATGVLRGIQLAGGLLDGSLNPSELETGALIPVDGCSWELLTGRIGAVALRAAAASTRDVRRARLLALLEIWAETPFADPSAPLRIGVAETERDIAHDEHGMAVALGRAGAGRRRFVDLRTGHTDPPSLGPVADVAAVPRRWGDAEQLRCLVALVRDRGPMPWDPKAAEILAECSGLSRAAAALILAGIPGTNQRSLPFLDARESTILRIKATKVEDELARRGEVSDALAELDGLTTGQRLDLLADVLPDDPPTCGNQAGFARWPSGWHRSGPLGSAARSMCPKRPWPRRGHSSRTYPPFASAPPRCARRSPTHVQSPFSPPTWTPGLRRGPTGAKSAAARSRHSTSSSPPSLWASAGPTPSCPPATRSAPALPQAVDLLHERLAHPDLLLKAGWPDVPARKIEVLRARFGDKPYQGPKPLDADSIDDGLTISTFDGDGQSELNPNLFFRPALLGDATRSQLLLATLMLKSPALEAAVWLLSDECGRMMARIRSGVLPKGAYEANPLASVPDLAAEVGERLDLEPDPAALYLQLLTLCNPPTGTFAAGTAGSPPDAGARSPRWPNAAWSSRPSGHAPDAARSFLAPGPKRTNLNSLWKRGRRSCTDCHCPPTATRSTASNPSRGVP